MPDLDWPRWDAVTLAFPWALLLLPLPLLVLWWAPPYAGGERALRAPFFARLERMLGPGDAPNLRGTATARSCGLWLAWLLVVLALTRPEELGAKVTRSRSARDLLLAVDLSGSMAAIDLSPPEGPPITRLDVVKDVVGAFIQARAGDRLGLVVFGDAPYVQVPFTTDTKVVEALLAATEVGMAGPRTALGDAVGLSLRLLEKSRATSQVVMILTDGNDTGSLVLPRRAALVAKERGVRLYVVGVGDATAVHEESLNEDVLREMATLTGGRYLRAQSRTELGDAYAELGQLEPVVTTTEGYQPKRSVAYLPLGLLGACFALAMVLELVSLLLGLLRPRTARAEEA